MDTLRLILAGVVLAAIAAATASCPPKIEQIRDAQSRLMGTLRTYANCTMEARDHTGRFLGRYEPRSRQTRNARGTLVSMGNTLPALIWAASRQAGSRSVMSRCRYCNSTSYGSCLLSPHKKHEHAGDETRCEYCGSSSYGTCLLGPTKKHRHGSGAGKCRWCGSTATGGTCLNSPNRNHQR
jgi:hypothetical protein